MPGHVVKTTGPDPDPLPWLAVSEELKKKLLQQCDGVLAIHEFHIWQLAGDRIIASAHIRCLNLAQYMQVNI